MDFRRKPMALAPESEGTDMWWPCYAGELQIPLGHGE